MRSILFHIPLPGFLQTWGLPSEIPIFGYGMMILLAYLICTTWAIHRGKVYGVDQEKVQSLVTTALISGLLGARICHVLLYRDAYSSWLDFFKIYNGGLVLYGFFLTTPWILIYKLRKWNISAHQFFMTFAPVLPLGIGIGRLGCFLNGCCYGEIGDEPWCVVFPEGTLPYQAFGAHAIHPTQLYAFLLGCGLALLLRTLPTIMPRIHGIQMALGFSFFYGCSRLIEEAFRADTPKHVLGYLTAGQGISVVLMFFAVILVFVSRNLRAPA